MRKARNQEKTTKTVSMQEVVGRGYVDFWRCKKRYRVVKGSRASKKSTTTALNLIMRLIQYPLANILVVRKFYKDMRQSCFAQLRWAINRLGLAGYFKCKTSPLEIEYLPTGQKILFRGLSEPESIASITVDKGVLCWTWVEEATQLDDEIEFNKLEGSIRGQMPDGYFVQFTITFNPWSSLSWLKARFFDTPSDSTLAITTNYKCNEWLSAADIAYYEEMQEVDPQRYAVEGLGEWGIVGGQYFREWRPDTHVVEPFAIPDNWLKFRSMDWGSAKPYACLWWAVDYDGNMYCYRELYGWGGKPDVGTKETAKQVGEHIAEVETKDEHVNYGVLDYACWASMGVTGPTIAEELNNVLIAAGLNAFGKCSKGRVEGANAFKQRLIGNKMMDSTYKPAIYFFKNCFHTIRTIPMIPHDEKEPEKYATDCEDHCFVAGTMVATADGYKPIEAVQTGDYVLTRQGYRRVLAAGMTRRGAKVMTAEFSNGVKLTGTGNHPMFVKGKGFIRFDAMREGDSVIFVDEVRQCQGRKLQLLIALYLTALLSDVTRYRRERATDDITGLVDATGNLAFATFITKYGNSTVGKSPQVATSITETATRLITILAILNCCQLVSTYLFMSEKIMRMPNTTSKQGNTLKQFEAWLRRGINPKRAGSGTENTRGKSLIPKPRRVRSRVLASSAEKNFGCHTVGAMWQNFVQTLAMPSTDGRAALTTRQGAARFVAESLVAAGSKNKKLVARPVELKAWCWNEQRENVYNLTVEDTPEYFANGILVHNCADSVVYACLSRPWTPSEPERHGGYDAWRREEERPSGWAM